MICQVEQDPSHEKYHSTHILHSFVVTSNDLKNTNAAFFTCEQAPSESKLCTDRTRLLLNRLPVSKSTIAKLRWKSIISVVRFCANLQTENILSY